MSVLTSLTSLDITVAMSGELDMSAFYNLRSLRDLSVHAQGADMLVPDGLSALTALTNLTLIASSQDSMGKMTFATRWDYMLALQTLDITCDLLYFGAEMLDLVDLSNLKRVNIISGMPANDYTTSIFAALVGLLATMSSAELQMNGLNCHAMRSRIRAGHLLPI